MATITPKPLVKGILLPATAAVAPGQYQVGAATTATIRSITFCNTDTVDRTFTLHLVASGDTPGAGNMVHPAITIKPNQTIVDDSIRELSTGDFISAFADIANKVSMRVDGSELT